MVEKIIAACDGASKGNPGPAAWAWVIGRADGSVDRWEAGPLGRATNNVAELTALERLLEVLDPDVPVEVRMDSQYAMKAVTTWLPGWRRKGWKTASGSPVANKDLVVRIDALLTGRDVDFVYTPAHQVDGDPLNDAADRAASHSARTQEAAGSDSGSPLPPPEAPARASAPRSRSSAPSGSRTASGSASSARRTRPSGGTLKARFAGRCRCGKAYDKGETISKNPDGWGHPTCV
ncbi:RNase H family protein [Streptomyces sp. NPDC000963]|uniref:ribonuclease H family protein n=1 Tax=unclassified Streptomyces TaxID=2593676 RepID=UPI000F7898F6|nr:ribonuclease H [Streptomyces sp. WAC08241]MYV64820.1 ribonuclease HI [Streptomyces sp. SID2131]RSS35191.1 ribonuclease HI [Streptomyces sp. WAC08241]